ncbi:hypothetical protein RHMOL_Rhmol01G0205900 [Rhododendron molle]|uniref:Uncharacterized protein n=1 Tax=Rhododendron molle TaxID=49168 RepID=A0ACC0Q5P1_RHOML|nr:hypothetical protein RHMOL_Rhmol01G0205900 [Rhododendron molle]
MCFETTVRAKKRGKMKSKQPESESSEPESETDSQEGMPTQKKKVRARKQGKMKSKQPESESSEPESETDSQEGMPTQKKKVRARKQGKMKSKQPESESSEPESETDSQEGMPTQKKKVRARKRGKMKSKQPESESSEPESQSDSQARMPSQKKKVRARKQGKMKSKQPESESSEPESQSDSQARIPSQKKKVHARKRGKMKSKQSESESDWKAKHESESDWKAEHESESEPELESESDWEARMPSQKKKGQTRTVPPIEITNYSFETVMHNSLSKNPQPRVRGNTQSQRELKSKSKKAAKVEEEAVTTRSQPVRKKPRKLDDLELTQQGRLALNRSNLQSMIKLLKDTKLSPEHIASLKKTPFWLLIQAIVDGKLVSDRCRKFDGVVVKVIKSYQEGTRSFRLGNRNVELTRDDIKLIFGISCGDEDIVDRNMKKEDTELAQRLQIKEARLSTTRIRQKIKELESSKEQQDIDDVARLLCLFLCVTLFFSTTGTTANWCHVRYLDNLENVKKYDWTGAIRNYLLKSVHRNHRDLKDLKGCSVLLPFWLCEHTKLLGEKNTHTVPRLLKWDMSNLRKRLKGFESLKQLPADLVNHTKLKQTAKERKIFSIENEKVVGEQELSVHDEGEMHVDDEILDGNEDELPIDEDDQGMTGVEQHEVGGEEHVQKGTVPINDETEEKGDELPVEGVKHLNTPTHGSFGPNFGSCKGTIDDEVVLGGEQHDDGEEKWVWVDTEAMPINDERKDVEQNEVGEEKWVWNEKGAMPINNEREERIGVVSMHDQDIQKDGEIRGLEDFNTPTHPSFEADCARYKGSIVPDSLGFESQEDNSLSEKCSGSTLAPNSLDEKSLDEIPTASLDNICATIVDQSTKDANAVIDELKKRIENFEKEKKNAEIENMKILEQNQKVLQSQKKEIELLSRKLEDAEGAKTASEEKEKDLKCLVRDKDIYISTLSKKIQILEKQKVAIQKLNKDLEEQIQEYEMHQITQAYGIETEKEVHQVTQKATMQTIKKLQKERDELEEELTILKVYELTQKAMAEKGLQSKMTSPPSKFKRVKARKDRKKNLSQDYVYPQLKRKSPEVEYVDVENCPENVEDQKTKKKLKNLKPSAETSKLIHPETWVTIQKLWKAANSSTVVWQSACNMLYVEVGDIENLLFDDPISNRCVDAYSHVLMQQHIEALPTFALETQKPKSFIFNSFFLDVIKNKDQKQLKKTLASNMRKALPARFLLFPILIRFHWTLLVLDKWEGHWKFYNSLSKRNGKDEYCDATTLLRKVVASHINIDTREVHKASIPDTVEIVKNSPQQPVGRKVLLLVDCAIVVISIMKKYINNEEQSTQITMEECRQIRTELIHLFLNDTTKSLSH